MRRGGESRKFMVDDVCYSVAEKNVQQKQNGKWWIKAIENKMTE